MKFEDKEFITYVFCTKRDEYLTEIIYQNSTLTYGHCNCGKSEEEGHAGDDVENIIAGDLWTGVQHVAPYEPETYSHDPAEKEECCRIIYVF